MRIRPRFFIGVGLIAAAIGYLIFSAIRTTSEYYLTVPEVAARQTELGGQALRVAGRVKAGNIDWDPNSLTLKFEIAPIPDLGVDVVFRLEVGWQALHLVEKKRILIDFQLELGSIH